MVGLLVVALVGVVIWAWAPDLDRSSLEAHYLRAPSDMVTLNGVRLHVRDSAPKASSNSSPAQQTVIFIHGMGSHLQTWNGWATALNAAVRTIQIDLPGSGLSPPDPTGDYSDARVTEILLGLMDQLGIEKASLIGNSMGGRIAWKFASAHIERVEKLVLVSPDGYASPGFEYGKAADVPVVLEAMKVLLPKSMLISNLEIAYSDPSRLTQTSKDRYFDLTRAPGARQAFLDRLRQTILVQPEPLLEKITVPVLLLWGKDDRMIPISNAQDYLSVLPNVRLVKLPNLGHVPHEEDPVASLAPVRAFLLQE